MTSEDRIKHYTNLRLYVTVESVDAFLGFEVVNAARLDNRKAKDRFGGKVSMLGPEEVLRLTSHPVGGVCPFGLAAPLPVYCDISLKAFAEVVPAAGSTNSAIRMAPDRLAALANAEWVDVCTVPA